MSKSKNIPDFLDPVDDVIRLSINVWDVRSQGIDCGEVIEHFTGKDGTVKSYDEQRNSLLNKEMQNQSFQHRAQIFLPAFSPAYHPSIFQMSFPFNPAQPPPLIPVQIVPHQFWKNATLKLNQLQVGQLF